MEKLRTKLVRFLLKRDGLISVPEGWDVEYVKLAGDKVRLGQTLTSVITAYNELLEDNLKRCPISELKSMLKDAEIDIPKQATKESLMALAFNAYKMRKEK